VAGTELPPTLKTTGVCRSSNLWVADFGDDALNDKAEVLQFTADQQTRTVGAEGPISITSVLRITGLSTSASCSAASAGIGDGAVAALVDRQHRDRILQTHRLADLELGDAGKGFLVDEVP